MPFEKELLDGITAAGPVAVSELPARVSEVIGGVQDKMYDDVVRNGWYERRPDATRNRWTQTAIIALIGAVAVTIVLAAFTTFGLVGLALIILGAGPDVRRPGDAGPNPQGGRAARRAGRAPLGPVELSDEPDAGRA